MTSQVLAGMWKRNGYSLINQVYYVCVVSVVVTHMVEFRVLFYICAVCLPVLDHQLSLPLMSDTDVRQRLATAPGTCFE